MQELDAKYRALYEPLYSQRQGIVQGPDGGIPGFWGTVLEHHHLMQEEITEKDQGVLRHLQEVSWEPVEEGREGFKLKFRFEEGNPYFDNTVLEKTYFMKADEDDVLEEAVGTEIAWKKGKNVTVKVMKKKSKKKGKEGPPVTKTVKEASFFNFFDPTDVAALEGLDEEEDEEALEKLQDLIEEDYEMGCCFKDEIVPHAVRWYTGEAYGSDDEEDSEDDEDDDSEEYSDEEDSEEDEYEDSEEEDDDEDEEEEEEEEEEADDEKASKKGKGKKGKKGAQKGEQECKQQ